MNICKTGGFFEYRIKGKNTIQGGDIIQMKEYDNLDKNFSKMMQEASQFYWRQQY